VNSAALKRAKRDLRRRVLAARDAVPPEEREAAALAITRRVLELPELNHAGTVMAFSSFGSEIPMTSLIEAMVHRGITVALPRIVDGELEPRSFRPGDETTMTTFGAAEPAAGDPIDPGELDAVVTPAVVFDRRGGRIGYGGGFYDRFFTRVRPDAARIGVGMRVQVLDEDLPAGPFDLRVHVIVTPDETIRCRPMT
jgi:5-formyltetrahydrofolate cyclo-ligase